MEAVNWKDVGTPKKEEGIQWKEQICFSLSSIGTMYLVTVLCKTPECKD